MPRGDRVKFKRFLEGPKRTTKPLNGMQEEIEDLSERVCNLEAGDDAGGAGNTIIVMNVGFARYLTGVPGTVGAFVEE